MSEEQGLPSDTSGEVQRLRAFVERVLGESSFVGRDLDGGDAQDLALKYGVIVPVNITEPCGESCACAETGDFPQECFRFAWSADADQEAAP